MNRTIEEEAYKKQPNKVRNLVRRHFRQQQNKIALEFKNNPKKFWSHVNNKTRTREKIGELNTTTSDGQMTKAVTDREKADALNNFFASTCLPLSPMRHLKYCHPRKI